MIKKGRSYVPNTEMPWTEKALAGWRITPTIRQQIQKTMSEHAHIGSVSTLPVIQTGATASLPREKATIWQEAQNWSIAEAVDENNMCPLLRDIVGGLHRPEQYRGSWNCVVEPGMPVCMEDFQIGGASIAADVLGFAIWQDTTVVECVERPTQAGENANQRHFAKHFGQTYTRERVHTESTLRDRKTTHANGTSDGTLGSLIQTWVSGSPRRLTDLATRLGSEVGAPLVRAYSPTGRRFSFTQFARNSIALGQPGVSREAQEKFVSDYQNGLRRALGLSPWSGGTLPITGLQTRPNAWQSTPMPRGEGRPPRNEDADDLSTQLNMTAGLSGIADPCGSLSKVLAGLERSFHASLATSSGSPSSAGRLDSFRPPKGVGVRETNLYVKGSPFRPSP